MKKYYSIALVLVLFLANSCKKSASSGSDNPFIQITVNGQTYTEELADISGTGFGGETSCANKPGFLQFGGMIESSQFEFEAYLFHNENEVDFAAASSGSARLVDIGDHFYNFSGACNSHLDLNIDFLDKLQNIQNCSVETAGRTHSIESIKLLETSSTQKTYLVTGSFSCTIRNNANATFPLSGKYRVAISTLR